ncbi:MAG: argininosuccinate lyase [Desulfovibrio sp.]|nr:argininosuccinate lyase [Desulfovibrio sp.]
MPWLRCSHGNAGANEGGLVSTVNKSWGGRFHEGPSERAARFTNSERYDRALARHDIAASKAHAAMLARQGILTNEEAEAIRNGLDAVLEEICQGTFIWKAELEDVHMNIEARLTELAGEVGKKLHTARSRNDQVGLTFRLFVADALGAWRESLIRLVSVFAKRAREEQGTILPGLTHLQPAQPIALAHHLLAYASMFRRDVERLSDTLDRVRISPLGAAALAGTTYPLDPQSVADEFGFPSIYSNSLDAVSDRDFVIESMSTASMIMMHLSRFCEEIILWANPNFGYVRLPDAFATGSSIMPQKKNPDVCELMRGKTGRVYGHLMGILTVMKGLPLAYNRDMQEDKEGFLDTNETVLSSVDLMADMLEELTFCRETMKKACLRGFLNATELADYLVSKGIPFREAHRMTGEAVALAEEKGLTLEELPLDTLRGIARVIGKDVYQILAPEEAVARRETPGGTGPSSVRRQLKDLESWISAPL